MKVAPWQTASNPNPKPSPNPNSGDNNLAGNLPAGYFKPGNLPVTAKQSYAVNMIWRKVK